ncbi:YodC family protein [Alcaligenes phenolicus]|uniref:YodC family protein n=1 Tax=Alcaligenes phenolicus TaxID=232846 RepID=UPI00352F5FFA
MANSFEMGDIVILKSGGPKMTVTEVFKDSSVRTVWFAGSRKEDGVFPSEALLIYQEERMEE